MALTQLKTGAIADDAVTTDKLANAINTERTANTAKVSLTDNSVTLAKMAGGTDGQIITYDASGDPVAVGPGTDGQVLTSTGAGSPPAFEDASGTTINNNADNRVITGSGTANTLEGEATLTYDDPTLLIDTSSSYGALKLDGSSGGLIEFYENGTRKWEIYGVDSSLQIYDRDNTSYHTKFLDGGDLEVFNGNVKFADGHGIDFSATSNSSGTSTSELFDDYEEGTWTPVVDTTHISGTPTYHSQVGTYTKIGRQVFINGYLHVNSMSFSTTNATFKITGLPFSGATTNGGSATTTGSTVWQQLEWVGSSQSSYGTDNDVVLSPAVNDSTKVVFKTCSQDKYYVGEMLNNAVDGNQALLIFSFFYYTS